MKLPLIPSFTQLSALSWLCEGCWYCHQVFSKTQPQSHTGFKVTAAHQDEFWADKPWGTICWLRYSNALYSMIGPLMPYLTENCIWDWSSGEQFPHGLVCSEYACAHVWRPKVDISLHFIYWGRSLCLPGLELQAGYHHICWASSVFWRAAHQSSCVCSKHLNHRVVSLANSFF